MLNKILIFSVILFNLIIFNVYSNDQITFDVSEIEILDGGNKIIGKNRGSINTNDGVTIEADKFEFDKIKNILKAQGNIKVSDKLNNYDFNAQKISYFKYKENGQNILRKLGESQRSFRSIRKYRQFLLSTRMCYSFGRT